MSDPSASAELLRDRLARNEAVYRDVNEQIDALNSLGPALPRFPIVCECASEGCAQTLTIEHRLYEAVRAHPERFIVKAGHVAPTVDEVVEDLGELVVVAKRPGKPREVAEATDPRTSVTEAPRAIEAKDVDTEAARRLAENEARFREANEKIEEAILRLEADAPSVPFVCECGRPECFETVRVTCAEYERARQNPRSFLCSPGHEIIGPGLGRVLESTSRSVIMEKLGVAGEVAEDLDPRSG